MKILRAFQVVNKDGEMSISSTYNETNVAGEITNPNVRDSFSALDPELKAAIKVIEDYIKANRLAGD